MSNTNGLSRINDAMNEGAIAQPPANGKGRLGGRKKMPEVPAPAVDLPVDTTEAKNQYEGDSELLLNEAIGEVADIVETFDTTLTKVEDMAVQYISHRRNTSSSRVAKRLGQTVGGVNNAAGFRSRADQLAADFAANLFGGGSDS